jgi:hypothetical protein
MKKSISFKNFFAKLCGGGPRTGRKPAASGAVDENSEGREERAVQVLAEVVKQAPLGVEVLQTPVLGGVDVGELAGVEEQTSLLDVEVLQTPVLGGGAVKELAEVEEQTSLLDVEVSQTPVLGGVAVEELAEVAEQTSLLDVEVLQTPVLGGGAVDQTSKKLNLSESLESRVEVKTKEESEVLLERAKRKAAKQKARRERKKLLRKEEESNRADLISQQNSELTKGITDTEENSRKIADLNCSASNAIKDPSAKVVMGSHNLNLDENTYAINSQKFQQKTIAVLESKTEKETESAEMLKLKKENEMLLLEIKYAEQAYVSWQNYAKRLEGQVNELFYENQMYKAQFLPRGYQD